MRITLRPWNALTILNRLLALIIICCLPLSAASADNWQFSEVDRIVAVSDIHGAYDALVTTFQNAGVIDNELKWSGAKTHLVVTGDLLDRGADSRKVMDLIIRLEREAKRAGGQVHQLLGNHEVMNLIGDVRYVADGEYAAFAQDESEQEREYWYQLFSRSQPEGADEAWVKSEFDQKAPPGFFGHRRAFRTDGYYGKWLLEKPLMIVINGTAFVHGGAPPYIAEHGLNGVNLDLKADLSNYVTALNVLEDSSVLSPIDRYREAPAILQGKIDSGQLEQELSVAAHAILELRNSPLNSSKGPLWYRGTARCTPLIEADGLNAVLDRVDAKRIVFGHTTTSTRHIQQRMQGQIVEIDTGMLTSRYDGSGNALVITDNMVSVTNQNGATDWSPIPHPTGVGGGSESIDDEVLETILTTGSIIESETTGTPGRLLQISAFDKTVFAYFKELSPEHDFIPEIAAYKLDRMLGLFMVPVTVQRDIAGQKGTLQYAPAETINEPTRVMGEKGLRASCSIDKQKAAMYVFDTLIHNPERTPTSMLYNDDWQLILVDHHASFGTGKKPPAYLDGVEVKLGDTWRTTLLQLSDSKLREDLGDVLDGKRLKLLAERRDALINKSGP